MIDAIQRLLVKIFEIVCRLTMAQVFIESGLGKLRDLPKVIEYFESLKIPYASIQAPFVSALELICGCCILVGFFTRLAPIPLIGTMVVALITAKAEDVTGFSALTGLVEYLYIVILLGLVAYGSKTLSVDHLRRTKRIF